MERLVVAVDRSAGVSPAELAAAWDGDVETRGAGLAAVEAAPPGEFLGDVLALVVMPLAMNLASSGPRPGRRPDRGRPGHGAAAVTGNGDGPGVTIRIAGLAREPDGTFGVRGSFGDAAEYEGAVTSPGDRDSEQLLAWWPS